MFLSRRKDSDTISEKWISDLSVEVYGCNSKNVVDYMK